jgi:IS605 OrfB family transposase
MDGTAAPTAKPAAPEAPMTQRAYTLRLRGAKSQDNAWRDALWATHEAVNKGAKVFGDWLLTLRGGLCHELAEPAPPPKGRSRSDKETEEQRKNRRILLALSWLSVEDACGAPNGAVRIASGTDADSVRREKLLTELRRILEGRGLDRSAIEVWVSDCADSLSARIRDDAVWVNRSALFDAATQEIGTSLTRDEAWDILEPFFGSREAYFADVELTEDVTPAEEKAKDLVQKAGQWLSSRFGTGTGASFESMSIVYAAMAEWAKKANAFESGTDALESLARSLTRFQPKTNNASGILGLISGPGYKSATRNIVKSWEGRTAGVSREDLERFEETAIKDEQNARANVGRKGRRPWSDRMLKDVEAACGFTYLQANGPARHKEFAVMLDHAARRVSIGHSWIKRAEAERRRFEADAQRLSKVPDAAEEWLDAYVQERSGSAGGEYRIRRRAIEGWDEVLKRWKTCATEEDRIAAAREVQADPEIDKFGDIQLFEALASDDALCVWRNGNDVAPDHLKDYVFAHDARFKQRQFKVPAYRHPDALRHPVFVDFGNSRWKVEYSALEAAKAARSERRTGAQDAEWLKIPRGIRLGLWDGEGVRDFELGWSCKRLAADLALQQAAHNGPTRSVSRADRLGRAAAGLKPEESPSPAGLLTQAEWNARLQASRSQLNDLAAYLDRNNGRWDDKAKKMRDRLAWLVTFSAKLECRGPFMDYAARHGITPNRKGEYYPNADRNKADKREGHAKLMLARLPGLRVLSVDLGHRFAAACAVWETLSRSAFDNEIAGRYVIDGGSGEDDLYLQTRHTDHTGKERTTIYRRVGGDRLPDVSDHPAPWARLDRQFFIKLQGEESPARKASPDEIETIRRVESDLGYVREAHNPLPTEIDELLGEAVRLVRLGLRRHGDAARIAYAFHPESARLTPGGGVEAHTPDTRRQAILDALIRWHGMATSERWNDRRAMEEWRVHIQPLLATDLPALTADADRWERKRFRNRLEAALTPAATALARDGAAALHARWSERWRADDAAWRPRLRQLRRMLLPRGLRPVDGDTDAQAAARKARRGAARHAGGLSLTRIATIRELYQVQKAYAMRPEPDNPRKNIPGSNDDRFAEFGRSILEAVERLREQRVKQLASRIAEAALGVGRVRQAGDRDRKRPMSPVDAPCHAIVIESLRNYRPDELQTRRENRALMNWSAGKVRKYLEEACQLHGLLLREVMPNYTSRQCSRTGLPGLRCDDVPIDEFLTAPWWKKAVDAADKRLQENGSDSLDRMLVALWDKWDKCSGASDQDRRRQRTLRLPRAGGDLFVAAPPSSCRAAGHRPCPRCNPRRAVQADLNAAANIGLRALLDPDFPGRWWYVPCIEDKAAGTAVPRADKVKGSMCFGTDPSKPEQFGSLLKPSDGDSSDGQARSARRQGTRSSNSDGKETTNFWSDPRAAALRNATNGGFWLPTPAYWRWVRKRVVAVLWQANGLSAPPADLVRDGQP